MAATPSRTPRLLSWPHDRRTLSELGTVEDERWEDEAVHNVWGEENETDKWITEEAKPRINRLFWSSVG
jgi:hypothetical protein